MKKKSIVFAAMLVALCATGCVTTMDKPRAKVDKQQVVEANVKLGMAYLERDNREGAIRAFGKALEADHRSAEANQGMALVYQLNGEYERAENSFQKALKSRSDFSKSGIYFSYGRFLFEREEYTKAFKYFEMSGDDIQYLRRSEALYYLGLTSLELNNKVRAVGAFERALGLNRRYGDPALELAVLSFEERDYSQAKKYLDRFAKNSRHTPRSLWLGIRIERIFGNKDKEASYALALKNLHPYSQEYLDYKTYIENQKK